MNKTKTTKKVEDVNNEYNVVRIYQEYQNKPSEKAYDNIINNNSIIKRTINNKKQKVEREKEKEKEKKKRAMCIWLCVTQAMQLCATQAVRPCDTRGQQNDHQQHSPHVYHFILETDNTMQRAQQSGLKATYNVLDLKITKKKEKWKGNTSKKPLGVILVI